EAIEVNFSCHGVPKRRMGAAVGQDCVLLEEICDWVNAKATIPMWAKMTPNITDIKQPARVVSKSGCEGIAAINTIMSVMGINLDTLRPEPCVKGRAVHPIALSGIGGVETGGEAAEFILLGANTVQVCTGVMIHGYGIVKKKLCFHDKAQLLIHRRFQRVCVSRF
ncbi:Dihydropyrimidine dehydrogenase (NADP(+)) protein, partial [Thalictrum thalictroides]